VYRLEDYRNIVPDSVLYSIYKKARLLYGTRILHINSTYQGGGVAVLLDSLVPLLNEVGTETGWRILHGNPNFFTITKRFHNTLQGQHSQFTLNDKALYRKISEDFSVFTHINHDLVIIHDPQPLPLIQFYKKRQPWIWRCHVDVNVNEGNHDSIDFLKTFLIKYDRMIVSNKKYILPDFPVDPAIILPAIDPGVLKNMPMADRTKIQCLKRFGIPLDKPLVTQVSRFDKWKDPEGVLKVFQKVKEKVDCRLVLCGSMASDDPEGITIYESIKEKAADLIASGDVLLITIENDQLVNSLQSLSSVILQKSIKEGFGLTIAESMWKKTPVVAGNVGGIPSQITDGENGYLVDPFDIDGCADRVIEILTHKKLAEKLGKNGHATIKSKFLMTRLLENYLDLIIETLGLK